jgi:hypothetical protein
MSPFYKQGQLTAIQTLGLKLAQNPPPKAPPPPPPQKVTPPPKKAPIMGGRGRQMKDIGKYMP